MAVNKMNKVPYDDFKLLEVIDPDIFDANNAALVAKIDELVDDVNGKATTITNLTNTVNSNETDIENKLTTLTNTVNTNETDIENKVTALTNTVNTNETDIENKLTTLTNTVNTNETDIESKVTTLTNTVGTNKTNIESTVTNLTNTVSSNKTDIESKLNTHKGSAVLDHPDASVTTAKIKDAAVTLAKIDPSIQTQVGIGQVEARVTTLENQAMLPAVEGTFELKTDVPVISVDAKVNGGLNFEMTARPLLVNLLGNDGDFENDTNADGTANGWAKGASVTASISTTTGVKYGLKAQRYQCLANSATNGVFIKTITYITGNAYYFKVNYHNVSALTGAGAYVIIRAINGLTNNVVSKTNPGANEVGTLSAVRTALDTDNAFNFMAYDPTIAPDVYIDGAMLVDLTAMFGAGNEPTVEWCDANFKFVNGIQPMMGLDVKACGKNLFEEKWRVGDYNQNTSLNRCSTYYPTLLKKGKTYVLSSNDATKYQFSIAFCAIKGGVYTTALGWQSGTSVNYTPAEDLWAYPVLKNTAGTNFTVDNLNSDGYKFQIEEGSTTTEYEAYQGSELLIDAELAGIETYLDKLTYKNGVARAIRNVKKVPLDGSLTWAFGADAVGYKRIKFNTGISPVQYKSAICKYNGDILLNNESSGITAENQHVMYGTGDVHISMLDTETGWGETYTPSAAEMAAFMNGWKMNNGTFGTPYNGTGTKTWTVWNATDNTGAVTTVPTTKATGWAAWATLWYALATPQEELLDTPIDGLSVYEGKTTIAMQTGIVMERVNPTIRTTDGVYYAINTKGASNFADSPLNYKTNKILSVLKNGVADNNWTISSSVTGTNGGAFAQIEKTKFDTTATHEVIYEVLHEQYDSQQADIDAEYTANLLDSHNELVKSVAEVSNEVAQKADKVQPGWIAPTFENGWSNFDTALYDSAGYYKDEFGMVHLKGTIKGGTTTQGTVIFRLAEGYRPKSLQYFGVPGNYTYAVIYTGSTGGLCFRSGSGTIMSLDGISFRAEV